MGSKYNYDPQADILAIYFSDSPFDYATEIGDLIVHFDKKDNPVYVEILNATKFLTRAKESITKSSPKSFSWATVQ